MPTAWRQGDLLAPDDAVALGLIDPAQRDTHRVLVISHSCDIAAREKAEPVVEVVIGEVLAKADGDVKLHNGHSIRRLDLCAARETGEEWVKFMMATKRAVPKTDFLRFEPWPERVYSTRQRRVLSRWLAQRYSRSAFPDAFNDWLGQRFGRDLEDLVKKYSEEVVGVYFDLDNGEDHERTDPDEPYKLEIELVYDTDDAGHADAAEQAARELTDLFKARCLEQRQWRCIELVRCDPVADTVFPLRNANEFRRWRLEYHSAHGQPLDESE
jgi:hypothetical protein